MYHKIQQYFLGKLNASQRSELLNQLETDASLKKEFIRFQNVHAVSMLSTQTTDKKNGEQHFEQFLRMMRLRQREKTYIALAKYAAAVVIAVISTLFIHSFFSNKDQTTAKNTLYVPAGQRAKLTLEDGTTVWLNAQSTLTYPAHFSDKKREVTLTGEAFFDVAKDPKKPFFVSAQQVEMKVLGTQFNVYNYPDAGYIRTDLLEGSVLIRNTKGSKGNVILHPNEQITVRDGKMTLGNIKNADYFLWKKGIYSFSNEKLLDIIEKLQLYYDVTIIVKDPEIFNVKYTGKFRQRDGIDEILRIIQKIYPFKIQKDTENNIITLRK